MKTCTGFPRPVLGMFQLQKYVVSTITYVQFLTVLEIVWEPHHPLFSDTTYKKEAKYSFL